MAAMGKSPFISRGDTTACETHWILRASDIVNLRGGAGYLDERVRLSAVNCREPVWGKDSFWPKGPVPLLDRADVLHSRRALLTKATNWPVLIIYLCILQHRLRHKFGLLQESQSVICYQRCGITRKTASNPGKIDKTNTRG